MRSIWNYFREIQQRKKSAVLAKERLKIIIAHQRSSFKVNKPLMDIAKLQNDLFAVIKKYMDIEKNNIKIDVDNKNNCTILELNVVIPDLSEEDK